MVIAKLTILNKPQEDPRVETEQTAIANFAMLTFPFCIDLY